MKNRVFLLSAALVAVLTVALNQRSNPIVSWFNPAMTAEAQATSRTFGNAGWDAVHFFFIEKGIKPYQDGIAIDDDALTTQKICELAGYSRVAYLKSKNFASCGDNFIEYWNGSSWIRSAACTRQPFIDTLTCDTPIMQPSVDIKINGQDGTISAAYGSTVTITWNTNGVARCDTGTSNMPGWGQYESLPTSGSRQVTVTQSGTFGIQCAQTMTSNMAYQDSVAVNVSASSSSAPNNQCRQAMFDAANGSLAGQGWTSLDPGANQSVQTLTENGTTFLRISDQSTDRGMRTEYTAISDSHLADRDWFLEMKARINNSNPNGYVLGMNMLLTSPGGKYASIYIDTDKFGPIGTSINQYNYARTYSANTTNGFHTYAIKYKRNGAGVDDDTFDVLFDNSVVMSNVTRNEIWNSGVWNQNNNGISFGIGSSPGTGSMDVAYVKFHHTDNGCTFSSSSSSSSSSAPMCPNSPEALPTTLAFNANEGHSCAQGAQLCNIGSTQHFNLGKSANVYFKYDVAEPTSTSAHCSSIRLHVRVDGNVVYTTPWMGWKPYTINGVSYPGDSQNRPLTTGYVNIGTFGGGNHTITTQQEGTVGGCNFGYLLGGSGPVTIKTDAMCASSSSSSSSSSSVHGWSCSNGVDDDGDGLSDANDPGCHTDRNRYNPMSYNPYGNEGDNNRSFTCQDGADNNGNGQVDAQDPVCHSDGNPNNKASFMPTAMEGFGGSSSFSSHSSSSSSSAGFYQCNNGYDDDGDGQVDANDPGCHTDRNRYNQNSYNPSGTENSNDRSRGCQDGIDNNGNGLIDAQDPACHSDGNPNNPGSFDPNRNEDGGGQGGNGCIIIKTRAEDEDGDRIEDDLPSFTVTLDGGVRSVFTDDDGDARFNNVSSGSHYVSMLLFGDWELDSVSPSNGTVNVTDGSGCKTVTFRITDTDDSDDDDDDNDDAEIEVRKTAGSSEVFPGGTIEYVITIKNTGDVDLEDLIVEDTIPSDLTIIDDGKPKKRSGNRLEWMIDVDEGDTETIRYRVAVPSYMYPGQTIRNDVRVTSKDRDIDIDENASAFITVIGTLPQTGMTGMVSAANAYLTPVRQAATTTSGSGMGTAAAVATTMLSGLGGGIALGRRYLSF